jgi:hypothetical protein
LLLLLPKDPVIWILEASYSDGIGVETPHSRSTKQMMKRKSLTGRANFPHIHPSEFFPGPEALRGLYRGVYDAVTVEMLAVIVVSMIMGAAMGVSVPMVIHFDLSRLNH